jgi:hypothetical protein
VQDPEDLETPEPLSIITYLSQFYHKANGVRRSVDVTDPGRALGKFFNLAQISGMYEN